MPLSRRAFVGSAFAAGLVPGSRAMAVSGEPFPVFESDKDVVGYKYQRQQVDYPTQALPGTVIVDPGQRLLYLTLGNNTALRFGVSVGKYQNWSGETQVGRMEKWPVWTPTPDHLKRNPKLIKYISGMPGGPQNPMGARAIYLYQNNADTTYRIHGTDVPAFIGTKATAGCFGMLNYDVIYLYDRLKLGARVVVLAG